MCSIEPSDSNTGLVPLSRNARSVADALQPCAACGNAKSPLTQYASDQSGAGGQNVGLAASKLRRSENSTSGMAWRTGGSALAAKNFRAGSRNARSISARSSAQPKRASHDQLGKMAGGTRREGTTPG